MKAVCSKPDSMNTNQIQIFNNPHFGEVRVATTENGTPIFCLADVCRALEITNVGNVKARLSPKGIHSADTLTAGGVQSMTYIDEANLYKCIFQSRKPDAEKFQDWVCEDVLPSIRKHGLYATPHTIEAILADPDFGIRLLTELKEERTLRIAAEKQIETDKPKVTFANAVETSRSSCLVGELAKILKQNGIEIGQNRLFEWLRKHHYLCSQYGQHNLPTQKAMENGLFEVKVRSVELPDGAMKTVTTTVVTGKGQIYFINKFLNK